MNDENKVQENAVVNENVEKTSTRITEQGKKYDKIYHDINVIKDKYDGKIEPKEKDFKTMEDVCNETDNAVKNLENTLLRNYFNTLDNPVNSYDELTDEQKADYDKYKEENFEKLLEDTFNDAKYKVFKVSKNRWNELETKEEEAKTFEKELPGEISKREAKIEKLSKDQQKNEGEINKLKAEIEEIKAIMGEFDSRIYGTINKAKDYQKTINNKAIGRLANAFKPYPQIDVMGDPDLANINKDYDDKKFKQNPENGTKVPINNGNMDGQEKATQGNKENPGVVAKENKDDKKVTNPEEKEPINISPMALKLGVVPDMKLTYTSSWALLGRFTAPDLTNEQRLEMLNDPECKTQILNAMKIAGGVKNPFKARQYRGIRDQVLELAKGPMMEVALKKYGIDSPDNVSKSFEELKARYIDERAAIDNDDKEAIAALDEKYDTMFNVDDFQLSSKKLKTLRTRFKDFVGIFANEEKRKQLGEAIDNKLFKPEEKDKVESEKVEPDATEIKEQESQSVDVKASDYIASKVEEKESKDNSSHEKKGSYMQGNGVNIMSVEQAQRIVAREEKEKEAKVEKEVEKETEKQV